MTETADEATQPACPGCGAEVAPDESFCEACGYTLTPTVAAKADVGDESPITMSRSVRGGALTTDADDVVAPSRPCASCGGTVGDDGYCTTCGTKAPRERDHYTEQPASWVAACCDRGIRHHRNEDATAVAADAEPGSRAVLVVCDGVSTSLDSDVASLAAARAARDVLAAHQASGLGVPASQAAALSQAVEAAAAQANAAVIDTTAPESSGSDVNTPSCTFSAAVMVGDLVVYGNIGDSRAYWVPDSPPEATDATVAIAQQLGTDDSVAQEAIAAGVPREEAESGPQAHAITKWLGLDSPDFVPRTGSITVSGDGWLVVCSDGLWNYVSEAAGLQTLIAELSATSAGAAEPLPLAEALVQWACDQGGKDNVSVALARHTGHSPDQTHPDGGEKA